MNLFIWQSITPIAIALSPVLLHVIDRSLEWFSPINRKILVALMREDKRVKEAVETDPKFEAIEHYFNFERDCHFVFAVAIFNMLSLFFAQAACTGNFLEATRPTLIMIMLLFVFLVVFLIFLYRRSIDAASAHARDWWKRPILIIWWKMVAIITFGIVIITDVVLHFSCVRAQGH